jgi:hypothetical protein
MFRHGCFFINLRDRLQIDKIFLHIRFLKKTKGVQKNEKIVFCLFDFSYDPTCSSR